MMTYKDWNIEAITGYKPITTYYMDFSIADGFGLLAIKDTYKRAVEGTKSLGYKYLTELIMVLNWKIWEYYENKKEFASLYNELWNKLSLYAEETLKGEELKYYYHTID